VTRRRALTSIVTIAAGVLANAIAAVGSAPSDPSATHAFGVSARVSTRTIRIGDRATLEIAIRTPPECGVSSFVSPAGLVDIEVDSVSPTRVEKTLPRWIHRTQIAFRPRKTGRLEWPAIAFTIDRPDGSEAIVSTEPVHFEVGSVLPRFSGRIEPFGARSAPPPANGSASALRALTVALGILAIAAASIPIARGVRRIRARRPATPAEKPWARALRELERAETQVDDFAAAETAAITLRRYMEQRFHAATRARTAEELANATPPFGATSRWPTFTELLLELDSVRFSHGRTARAVRGAPELVERVRRFIESSIPLEPLR